MAENTSFAPTNDSRVLTNALSSQVLVDEFDGDSTRENSAILKFISHMLMDDDLENEATTLHHYSSALQDTEKSLYDALTNRPSDATCVIEQRSQSLVVTESLMTPFPALNSSGANNTDFDTSNIINQFLSARWEPSLHTYGVKNNRYREEEGDLTEHNYRSKQKSTNNFNIDDDPDEPLVMYDDVMLLPNSGQRRRKTKNKSLPKVQSSIEGEGDHQQDVAKGFIDLSSFLMQCAQAVEKFNSNAVMDLMFLIRKHSSPQGTALERVSHYFANALEARLASNGSAIRASLNSKRIPCRGLLKAQRMYIMSCPFMTMSNLFAKSTIMKLADVVATVHIIDFGILYGFQWPCLIQALSERLGGPPKLRITGIDNPLPGFRPMERVLHTGRQLARYCERFNVPFEYNPIAKQWDKITLEDLKIEKGELVAVTSMYRLHNMLEKEVDCPRDAVLKLILKIDPHVFVHGVVNGAYNAPFFVSRFKEAFFHYHAMFDMFEATVPPEEEDQMTRIGFEENMLGKAVMNIIACEGTDIVESPETYKQWRYRTRRIGFRQLPVDGDVMRRMKKVKSSYHREFSVSEDDDWVLLEWKGRVIHAISCWQPACT